MKKIFLTENDVRQHFATHKIVEAFHQHRLGKAQLVAQAVRRKANEQHAILDV